MLYLYLMLIYIAISIICILDDFFESKKYCQQEITKKPIAAPEFYDELDY